MYISTNYYRIRKDRRFRSVTVFRYGFCGKISEQIPVSRQCHWKLKSVPAEFRFHYGIPFRKISFKSEYRNPECATKVPMTYRYWVATHGPVWTWPREVLSARRATVMYQGHEGLHKCTRGTGGYRNGEDPILQEIVSLK